MIKYIKKTINRMARKKLLDEEKKTHINININKLLLDRLYSLNNNRSKLIENLLQKYVDINKDKLI